MRPQLTDVPFRVLAATSGSKDNEIHRKPRIGMWRVLEKEFAKEGLELGA